MVSSFLHQPSYAPSNSSLCYFPCTNPPRLKPKSSRVVMLKFFHSKHGKPSTLSCLNRFGSLSSIKGKLQSYSIKRRPCVLPNLWQQFQEDLHIGVMVRCPQTFGHIVYCKSEMHTTVYLFPTKRLRIRRKTHVPCVQTFWPKSFCAET